MKRCAIRVISLLLLGCLLSSLFSPVVLAKKQEVWPEGITLSGKKEAAVCMEADSMAILYGKHMKKKHYPASITKIMTALVAIENGNLKDTVKFSHDAVYNIDRGSAHIARDEGEKMSLKNCLYGMMLESANECAYAIAEHVGGDYDTFIEMMNEKAKELGCVNTHFTNPHGLHNDEHYTCAYDMALIARAAYQNKTFRKIVGTATYTIPPTNKHDEETFLNNHHAMLHVYRTGKYLYEYCVGGKTGYTTEAQNTLVTFAKKGDQTLICVILNAGQTMHYNDTRALCEFAFSNFKTVPIKESNTPKDAAQSEGAYDLQFDATDAKIEEGRSATLPKGVKLKQTDWRAIGIGEDIFSEEPESDQDIAGVIEYSYAGHRVGSTPFYFDRPVVAQEEPGKKEPSAVMVALRPVLPVLPYVVLVVIVIVLVFTLRYFYVTAPYHRYYGSQLLKKHFSKRRKKRLSKMRQMREERWGR